MEQSPKGHALHAFEHVPVEELTQALRQRESAGLCLMAPAPMLHRLRDWFPTDLRQPLMGGHANNATQRPTADIVQHPDSLRRGEDAERG
jgi:hypothetical protein